MNIAVSYLKLGNITGDDKSSLLADEDTVHTANLIKESLEGLGHKAIVTEVDESFNLPNGLDMVFNQVYNPVTETGGNQSIESNFVRFLEEKNIPFTGSGHEAIEISNDKVVSKYLFLNNKVPTAKFRVIDEVENFKGFNLRFPVILKLTAEHSSVGLDETNIVFDNQNLIKKSQSLFKKYKQPILAEEYIDGKEINACVIGNGNALEVLPLSEITFGPYFETHPKIVDFKAKWAEGDPAYEQSVGICPANVDGQTELKIKEVAKQVHIIGGCRDYSRVDFRLDKDDNPYVLEINANPGIGPGDGAVRSAKAAGYTYSGFLEKVLQLASDRTQS